ncbi:MAG: NAD-dependent epimerase/dehydratase family protein [Bdellovibrionota bacterium]
MKILITGSTGMVGRNISEHAGIKKYDLLLPSRAELDLFNFEAVKNYIAKNKPDFIVHCAGKVGGIQANINEPVQHCIQNIELGRNVIMAAREFGVRKFINLGSSCMYPKGIDEELTENKILTGELESTNEGYALAKIVTQRLCSYISKESPEYQYKTLIPCNLYGRYDSFDPTRSHLIPAVIQKIHDAKKRNINSVEIWGDGNARREFMYAEDLADCVFECVTRFNEMPPVMNCGLGVDHTINEYYEATAKVLEFEGSFSHDLSKPVGMKRKLVSVKLVNAFGWKARRSLEEGLRLTYEYYLSYKEA